MQASLQTNHWYNVAHKHSGIRYVSQQSHTGEGHAILAARHSLHSAVKERNPERDSLISEHISENNTQQLAA